MCLNTVPRSVPGKLAKVPGKPVNASGKLAKNPAKALRKSDKASEKSRHCRSEHLYQNIGYKSQQQGYGNEDEYLFVL